MKAKSIYCANNDKIYPSASAASQELNVSRDLISKAATGQIAHAKYYVFAFMDEFTDQAAMRRQLLYNAFKIRL